MMNARGILLLSSVLVLLHKCMVVATIDAGAAEGSDDGEAVGSVTGATFVPEQFMSRGRHQFSFFLVLPLVNYSMILYVYPYVGLYI